MELTHREPYAMTFVGGPLDGFTQAFQACLTYHHARCRDGEYRWRDFDPNNPPHTATMDWHWY